MEGMEGMEIASQLNLQACNLEETMTLMSIEGSFFAVFSF